MGIFLTTKNPIPMRLPLSEGIRTIHINPKAAMSRLAASGNKYVIFIDDGGVLNDNERRAVEWQRLIGEFLSPRLGGEPLAWGEANRIVFEDQWERYQIWAELHAQDDEFIDFFDADDEASRWIREMCEHVGVATPDDSTELASATQRYVRARVRSGFPDMPPPVFARCLRPDTRSRPPPARPRRS